MRLILPLVFWFVVWEIFSRSIVGEQTLFPPPTAIFSNTYELVFGSGMLWEQARHSAVRFLAAAFIAVPTGFMLAILCAHFKWMAVMLNPLIAVTYPIPKVALFPFLLLLLGIGNSSKIALITIGIFYLIFIATYEGARKILASDLLDVVRVYRVTKVNYWLHFLARGTWPYFLIGLKAGVGYGITLIVVSELTMSNNGLGFFIWSAWDSFRVLDMYSGVVILGVFGFALNYACELLIKRNLPLKANL